jgi:hypothetical protein
MPQYIDKNKFYISTAEIEQAELNNEKRKTTKLINKLENETKEIIQEELQYIKNNSPCKPEYLETLNYNISNLNSNELGKLLTSEFYNPTVMKSMGCIINNVTDDGFYTSKFDNEFSKIDRERLHLQNLHVLSDSSVNGVVYLTDYDGIKDAEIVIKESKNGKDGEDLAHEAFVGLYALNNLRKIIPNFMYTYALVKGGAFIPVGKEALAFFNKKNKQTYHLLAENIPKAKSFGDVIKNCSNKEFISYYMQIMYSLEIAQNLYGFTHYDLHSENVLIARKSDSAHQILYQRPDGSERYVETNAVATIIDYGMSFIKLNGKTYNDRINTLVAGLPNDTHALFDPYKLLGFLSIEYLNTKNRNKEIGNTLVKMWRIFNPTEDIVDIIEKQYEYYFKYEKLTTATISEYIDLLEDVLGIRKDYVTNKDLPYFDCESKSCHTQPQILQLEGLDKFQEPRDVISVVELYRYIKRNPHTIKNFDINEMIYKFVKTKDFTFSYNNLYNNSKKMIYQLYNRNKQSNRNLYFNSDFLYENIDYYNDIIVQRLEDLHIISEITFNLKILYFYYNLMSDNLKNNLDKLKQLIVKIYNNLEITNDFYADFITFTDQNYKDYPKKSWLRKNYLSFRDLLVV